MEANFWHKKWEQSEIGFHLNEVNPLLVKHFGELSLATDSRVFVPLCGKTQDIRWLLSCGYRIAGIELSRIAIEQLFADLNLNPSISQVGTLTCFTAENIDIYVGDIFCLTKDELGPINAIYDRAALVALPMDMRNRYALHLCEITNLAPQLLIAYEYDQNLQEGPPFSISSQEIQHHYKHRFTINLVTSTDILGGVRGKSPAKEHVWVLKKPDAVQ